MTFQQHMQLEQRLVAILASMGQTERDVVETLAAHHALGQRNSPTGCVVARFLTQTLGALVRVTRSQAEVLESINNGEWVFSGSVHLPPAVLSVVREFDFGSYPELEEGVEVFAYTQEAG